MGKHQAVAAAAAVPFTVINWQCGMHGVPDDPAFYRIHVASEDAAGGPTFKYLFAPNPDGNDGWVTGWLAPVGGDETKLGLVSTSAERLCSAKGWHRILSDDDISDDMPAWFRTAGGGVTVDLEDLLPDDVTWWSLSVGDARDKAALREVQSLHRVTWPEAHRDIYPTPACLSAKTNTTATRVVAVWHWLPYRHGVRQLKHETRVHSTIQTRDPSLVPRLLAHITENRSRVVGHVLEHLQDVREAGPADLQACREALARLHALGIVAKNELSRHNFLVRRDGSVVMQHFDGAEVVEGIAETERRTTDSSSSSSSSSSKSSSTRSDEVNLMMEREIDSLEAVLGKSPSAHEEQLKWLSGEWLPEFRQRIRNDPGQAAIDKFMQAHGAVHSMVHWQLKPENGGQVTLTLAEHKELVDEWGRKGWRWTREDQARAVERFSQSQRIKAARSSKL